MEVLIALPIMFIWWKLVDIDDDLKDICDQLKKMNGGHNNER